MGMWRWSRGRVMGCDAGGRLAWWGLVGFDGLVGVKGGFLLFFFFLSSTSIFFFSLFSFFSLKKLMN